MKKLFAGTILTVLSAMSLPMSSVAQDKFEASVGADLVSSYIWRGQDLGNASIQPALSLSYKGISLSAWGSAGLNWSDTREVDLTLGYSIAGFSVSVTDYWFDGGPGYFHYRNGNTNHTFEAQVGYDFGFAAVNWYTNFAGNTGFKADGSKAYASYFAVSAPFAFAGLDWEAAVGATPWQNDFYAGGANSEYAVDMIRGFAVCNVSIMASRAFRIAEGWSVSVFGQIVWNPSTEAAHFVAGIGF